MRPPASYWITQLALNKHPEGGYFRETYRSAEELNPDRLPHAFEGTRNVCTSIYFLLERGQFSAFHRIKSDEIWHFYYGDPLIVYEIISNGQLRKHSLGQDPEQGQQFQCVVKAGHWFASAPEAGSEYALTGCTVAPGFDFADFELADSNQLGRQFPDHVHLISLLTR